MLDDLRFPTHRFGRDRRLNFQKGRILIPEISRDEIRFLRKGDWQHLEYEKNDTFSRFIRTSFTCTNGKNMEAELSCMGRNESWTVCISKFKRNVGEEGKDYSDQKVYTSKAFDSYEEACYFAVYWLYLNANPKKLMHMGIIDEVLEQEKWVMTRLVAYTAWKLLKWIWNSVWFLVKFVFLIILFPFGIRVEMNFFGSDDVEDIVRDEKSNSNLDEFYYEDDDEDYSERFYEPHMSLRGS